MADTIGVGLVGYKFMGRAHSNAYRQVAILVEFGKRHGNPHSSMCVTRKRQTVARRIMTVR